MKMENGEWRIDNNPYFTRLFTPEGAFALGSLLGAWHSFRDSHDLKSERIQCCEKTHALFEALEKYEPVITGK